MARKVCLFLLVAVIYAVQRSHSLWLSYPQEANGRSDNDAAPIGHESKRAGGDFSKLWGKRSQEDFSSLFQKRIGGDFSKLWSKRKAGDFSKLWGKRGGDEAAVPEDKAYDDDLSKLYVMAGNN